jgi:hypothetical protein
MLDFFYILAWTSSMLITETYEVSLLIFIRKGIILKIIRTLCFSKFSNEMCLFFDLPIIRLTSFIS